MKPKLILLTVILILGIGIVLIACTWNSPEPNFTAVKDDSADLPRNITVIIDDTMSIDLVRIPPGSFKTGVDIKYF